MLCLAFSAGATDASVTFSDNGYPSGAPIEYVQSDNNVLLIFSKGSVGSIPSYNPSQSAVLLSRANTMTVTGGDGVTITEVAFTFSAENYAGLGISGQPDAVTVNGTEGVWKGSANSIEFTASKTTYLSAIKVTYSGFGTIAPPEVSDINAFLTERPDQTTSVKGNAVVVYQTPASVDSKYLFLKDNSGWLCVSGNTFQTYAPSDIVPGGYQGTYTTYGATSAEGTPMLFNPRDFKAAVSKDNEIAPLQSTVAEIASCPIASLVCLKGVTINTIEGSSNYSCSEGDASVTLRNQFNTYISTGVGRTVTGMLIRDEGTYMIYPISVTDADGKEYVRTPAISPAAGEVWSGDKVTITCATTGSTIYYTLDGTEPTSSSILYTEPFVVNNDATVKAIAVKNGMAESSIATAVYTVKTMAANMVMFNFNDPASLMTAAKYGNPTSAQFAGITSTTALGENVFVAGTVSVAPPATATVYKGTAKYELRPGKGAKIVISGNGNKIKTVTFAGSKFNNITTTSDGVMSQETGVYTAPEGGIESVTFSTPSSGLQVASISTITVECIDAMSGIGNLNADDIDAPVEYYNMQGIRVSTPANGIFLRRQGSIIEKVIIR